VSSVTGRSPLARERAQDARERNPYPLGTIVELVPELVHVLLEQEDVQQARQVITSRGRRGESPAVCR